MEHRRDTILSELLGSLNPENASLIQAFLNYTKVIRNVKQGTLENYVRSFDFLFKGFKGDFLNITNEQALEIVKKVRDYKASDATKMSFLERLKSFFKWIDNEHDECNTLRKFKDVKLTHVRANIKLNDLVTAKDFDSLINSCNTNRERALLAIFYDCGCRPCEVASIRLKDISVNEFGIDITINKSKTKNGEGRTVNIVRHKDLLLEYLNNHKYWLLNDRESYLFYRIKTISQAIDYRQWKDDSVKIYREYMKHNDRNLYLKEMSELRKKHQFITKEKNPYEPINTVEFRIYLSRIAKRAGLNKRINLKLFRHSWATRNYPKLRESVLRYKAGWSSKFDVCVYAKIDSAEMNKAVYLNEGVKPEELKERISGVLENTCKPIVCRNKYCGFSNASTAHNCLHCGIPLEESAYLEKREEVNNKLKMEEATRKTIKEELSKMLAELGMKI